MKDQPIKIEDVKKIWNGEGFDCSCLTTIQNRDEVEITGSISKTAQIQSTISVEHLFRAWVESEVLNRGYLKQTPPPKLDLDNLPYQNIQSLEIYRCAKKLWH